MSELGWLAGMNQVIDGTDDEEWTDAEYGGGSSVRRVKVMWLCCIATVAGIALVYVVVRSKPAPELAAAHSGSLERVLDFDIPKDDVFRSVEQWGIGVHSVLMCCSA